MYLVLAARHAQLFEHFFSGMWCLLYLYGYVTFCSVTHGYVLISLILLNGSDITVC